MKVRRHEAHSPEFKIHKYAQTLFPKNFTDNPWTHTFINVKFQFLEGIMIFEKWCNTDQQRLRCESQLQSRSLQISPYEKFENKMKWPIRMPDKFGCLIELNTRCRLSRKRMKNYYVTFNRWCNDDVIMINHTMWTWRGGKGGGFFWIVCCIASYFTSIISVSI